MHGSRKLVGPPTTPEPTPTQDPNAVCVVRKIPFSCCSEFSDFYTLASPNLELNISHAGSVE